MRGEHFLLLAERANLLSLENLIQLRRVLANQSRPATGEAVARLLVDRGLLSSEQARQLIDEGTGTGSPLIALGGKPAANVTPSSTPDTVELILAPVERLKRTSPLVASGPTAKESSTSLPAAGKLTAANSQPDQSGSAKAGKKSATASKLPAAGSLADLEDSLQQYMAAPAANPLETPLPIFTTPGFTLPKAVIWALAGSVLVLLLLFGLISLTKLSAG